MVTPTINTMQAYDSYYGGNGNTAKKDANGISTLQIILIGGIAVTTALAVYFAIKNNDLKKKLQPSQ